MTDKETDGEKPLHQSLESQPAPIGINEIPDSHMLQPKMPVMINRPPSVAESMHSATSVSGGAGPRTTTTSRRGGRARSRSPVTTATRPTSTERIAESYVASSQEDRSSPELITAKPNISSAAAAGAAAAKALSNSRGSGRNGRNQQWFDDSQGGSNHRGERRDDSRYRQNNDGSRNWPAEEDVADRNGKHNRTRRQHTQDRPSHNNSGDQYSGLQGRGSFERYSQGGSEYDRSRYGGGKNGRSTEQQQVHPNHYGHDTNQHTRSYGYNSRDSRDTRPPSGMAPIDAARQDSAARSSQRPDQPREGDMSSTAKRNGGGSISVIGTPTPIHVPRASEPQRQAGTPSSVFRDRPSGDLAGHGASEGPVTGGDSPSKILLSLRTPTTSFEEREHATSKCQSRKASSNALPLSPEEPPRIQNSHHQNQVARNMFFEPQRSPKDNSGGTLEMAPSFSLFNHSFDSLGDGQFLNVGAPLDTGLNSFGPSGSGDNELDSSNTQLQLPNPSFGGPGGSASFSAQPYPLNAEPSGSGGMLTFGMSPVNSFGNVAPSGQNKNRNGNGSSSGNMMVLGGPEGQETSPTQILGMYPSYSGGGYGSHGGVPSQSPPFRQREFQMQNSFVSPNIGSFGAPSMPRSFSGADHSPRSNYHANQSAEGNRAQEALSTGPPGFYIFLRRHKRAFLRCSFLLPGLKAALLESPITETSQKDTENEARDSNKLSQKINSPGTRFSEPTPQEAAISMRRVVSAVCAFGGCTPNADHFSKRKILPPDSTQSIFREKKENAVTVTPSSTMGTPEGNRSSSKAKYDDLLPSRYYENENRLSWEFEESPPVGSVSDDEDERDDNNGNSEKMKIKDDNEEGSLEDPSSPSIDSQSKTTNGKKSDVSSPTGADQPKMRYRCKLCGLPKQNHTCMYQQSLQRSIGVMIYPAVNAFTSSEPGLLAPALEEMNNFVGGCESLSSGDLSPSRPTPDRKRQITQSSASSQLKVSQVTPVTQQSGNSQTNSPGSSSLSTAGSGTPHTPCRTPAATRNARTDVTLSGGAAMSQRTAGVTPPSSRRKKRQHSQMQGSGDESDLLFVSVTELKPEQSRIVTPTKSTALPDAYTYPSLPLPYAQRKRLSDNLFALSKEVPQLTDECAVVLREARDKDMWDLAVAELMTQVVVIIHCADGDNRFEGLRQYLLSLGIAC